MQRRWILVFFLFVSSVYLLTASGRIGHADGGNMFQVSRSIYKNHWFNVDPCTGGSVQCAPAPDGKHYSAYGFLPSILAAPLYAVCDKVGTALHKDPWTLAGVLVCFEVAIIGALTAAVFAAWVRGIGFSFGTALAMGVIVAFGTPDWFYSVKGFYSEPHLALGLVASAYLAHRAASAVKGNVGLAGIAGLSLGAACASRLFAIVTVPFLLLYLWQNCRNTRMSERTTRQCALSFLGGLAVFLLLIGVYNYVRFGNARESGYSSLYPNFSDTFSTPLLTGLKEILFNGEVGVIWYAPVVVLSLFAWRAFWRRHPREGLLCFGVSLITLLFFSKFSIWHAGWAYGPRYMAPTLPFLILPLSDWIAALLTRRNVVSESSESGDGGQTRTVVIVAFLALSFVIQGLSMVSAMSRYYNLQRYYEVTGKKPWWNDSLILQNVAAVSELAHFQPGAATNATADSQATQADDDEAKVRENAAIAAAGSMTPDEFLQHIPGSVNLRSFDFWLLKASFLGVPRALVTVVFLLLVGIAVGTGRLLILLSRDEAASGVSRAGAVEQA